MPCLCSCGDDDQISQVRWTEIQKNLRLRLFTELLLQPPGTMVGGASVITIADITETVLNF